MSVRAADKQVIRLAVDIGGTFTDVVLEHGARRTTRKVLTTAQQPEMAVLAGTKLVLADAGLEFSDIDVFVHGTTLATNAVLERRGAKTALLTTEGFRDVIEIGGESRHDQYDLMLEKRPPLVRRALRLTVSERLDAKGKVLVALDETAVKRTVEKLRESGIESLAISFLHAYRNPIHERRAAQIISRLMPELSISLSSEVAPEIREYERTSTVVVNAYVRPLISAYLARMERGFSEEGFGGTLYLVTSSGGLTTVETAQKFPVRLVESGPAGGAIFASDIARAAEEQKVLAFDMGGTTAKVCLIDDFMPENERVYEVDRAARFLKGSGLPLRIPVIDLVEIGAGGGSIAKKNALGGIDVGPESASSEPGPACYGRGGTSPTVTDSAAVLGLIDPASFAGGSIKIDIPAAEKVLSALGEPLGMSAHVAAYAVHELVCESMAAAARVHAVEKGKSLSKYTMISFGGAAPLHAARVAEKLGVNRIVIPANAGVGSAVGFLRAPVAYEVVRSFGAQLQTLEVAALNELLDQMQAEARDVVEKGALGRPLSVRRMVYMRYLGQGHEIGVPFTNEMTQASIQGLIEAFETEYSSLFQRNIPNAAIEIISCAVLVSTGAVAPGSSLPVSAQGTQLRPMAHRSFFDGRVGTSKDIPIYHRGQLPAAVRFSGPAVIAEDETTTFVSEAFEAELSESGSIIMERKVAGTAQSSGDRELNLVDLQVMWNRLIAVTEEQAQALIRTAFSPIVRECGDLSAGVFDTKGRMLAQAITGAPGHVNTMAESVGHFLDRYPLADMRPGDAFITNDPWMGTGHLYDFVVVTPCFDGDRPVGLFACTSHLMDIGGIGFGPDGTDVFMEGIYIPPLKLFDRGKINETLIAIIRGNSRLPLEAEGDTYALAACNDIGCKRLLEMMREYGLTSLDTLGEHIIENSRLAVLSEVAKLEKGTWSNSMTVDGYDAPIKLNATLTISEDGIHVDYEGTSRQSGHGINVAIAYTRAYTCFGLACAVSSNIPNNAGSLSAFTVSAPAGSVLNAPRPAPVTLRHIIGQMLPDVVFGCLHQVVPERVPAEGTSSLWVITLRGETEDSSAGRYGFTLGFTCNGGTGARPLKDGLSATAYPTSVKGTPVEIAESQMPVIFWRKELRENSSGNGKFRGGLGQSIEIEVSTGKSVELLASFDRVAFAPRGRDGGGDGAAGFVGLASGRVLKAKGAQEIPSGERLVVLTPGGGGFGKPADRDAHNIQSDLADEMVSHSGESVLSVLEILQA